MNPQSSPSPSNKVNYLYFGSYFALLVLMSASSVFAKQNLSGSRIFFFLYAAGQAALETSALIFLGHYIRRFLGKFCFSLYIGATFFFLLLHCLDCLMDRILDLSIWETISFVLDEDWHNFLYLLDASGIALWAWGLIFLAIALIPFGGLFLYRLSEFFTNRKPMAFYPEKFLLTFICLPAALLFWDFSASRIIHPDAYTEFLQSLPWKWTFLEPKTIVLPIQGNLREPQAQQQVAQVIANDPTVLAKRPNIYLFVVESLRKDIITPDTSPHIYAFGQGATLANCSLSNANGTNLSWFSIFHSQFAYHWERVKKRGWEMGSPALALLKKWGYQIRVYTSAQLGYYGLEELLFGKERSLLHSYQSFHHTFPLGAAEGDAEALDHLQQDLATHPDLKEGQVFIIFWDSTHFDYSWPKNWSPKFTPFATEFAYFQAFYSKNSIELIKNRYRNAVAYIDSLFGQFIDHLPDKENAIIVFTGDHGEEFFEHGHLFHNSHLTKEQTHIPLLMRFGSQTPPKQNVISQIDIFPSIIDFLSGKEYAIWEGHSIFHPHPNPFAVVSRFNASRTPFEFYIHNGRYKLIARFPNRRDIAKSENLLIRSIRTEDDQTIPQAAESLMEWTQKEFAPSLLHLFDRKEQ